MAVDFDKLLSGLGEEYDKYSKLKKFGLGVDSLSKFGGLLSDYQSTKAEAYSMDVQASEIELQAQQRINQIRESFNDAVGTATFSATRRGVVAGEGSAGKNIEQSSIELGKDMALNKRSAKMKAKSFRTQAKINRILGKGSFASGLLNIGSSLLGGFSGSEGTKSLQVKPGIKPTYRG